MIPFFDSNVVVYMVDRAEPEKRAVARALFREHLQEGSGLISPQIVREFYFAATSRLSTPLSNCCGIH